MFTLATWNVNSIKMRLPHVLQWLAEHQPDVLALQETKSQDCNFPQQAFSDINYHVIYVGQKAYNGVAIVSRHPPEKIVTKLPGFDDQQRFIAASFGDLRIINIYVPNGQLVNSEKYQYKLRWLEALKEYLSEELSRTKQVVVVGDYNIAPDDRDVHDPKVWEGQVLVSDLERKAFQAIIACGLCDTFRLFEQVERQFSWWDYRALAFRRNHGLRIDHILASEALCSRCVSCEIDKTPRKWEKPTDHAPVLAKFDIQ